MANTKNFDPQQYIHEVLIVDASVLLKPFLNEEGAEKVEQLIKLACEKSLTLMATHLLKFEFLNSIAKKVDNLKILYEFSSEFNKLGIGIIDPDEKYNRSAIEISCKHPQVSYYDASYHALAKDIGGTFITADKKYYDAVKHLGNIALLA